MVAISEAAEQIGLRPSAAAATFDELATERPFPAIVHWRGNHFVVLYDIDRRGRARIADPAHGIARLTRAEFERALGGRAGASPEATILYFQPTPAFYEHESPPAEGMRGLREVGYYLVPYRRHLVQLMLGMAVGGLLSLALAFLNQSLIDVGIARRNVGFVTLVLIAQLALFAGATFGEFSRSWITLHLGTRLNVAMTSDFLVKLSRLPMGFFDGRMTGDLMQRIGDLTRVQSLMTSTLPSAAFMVVNLLVYSALLVTYDRVIFTVFAVGSALYIGWILVFLRKRKALDYRRFEASAGNQSGVIAFIQGMQELRLHNAERRHRWKWERLQAHLYKVSVSSLSLEQYQSIGSSAIHRVKNLVITFLAARAVISGDITLGMMMTIQFVLGNLDGPVANLVTSVRSVQDAKISIDRIGEIFAHADEDADVADKLTALPSEHSIHLRDVSFRYGATDSPLVLKHLSVTIPQGGVTAIVGSSGSGKTTLLKLLLQYYAPSDGVIEVGAHSLRTFHSGFWRTQCGVVMQDGFIFSDTIAGNIAIADETVDRERLLYAAKVANIEEFVDRLPLGYRTKIGPEGIRLSGGQRQRILIARAVYKDPQFLFFDEATSSLDADTERAVMDNLRLFYRGRTTVIAAHRLSTVRNADQIIVLGDGQIIEQGDHASLTAAGGTYFTLIRNQLDMGG